MEELDDEQILSNMLMELRNGARLQFHVAQTYANPDAKETMIAVGEHMLMQARALHRFLQKAGVKGLGPIQ